jgi:cytochrome c oxidase subunit 1
MVATAVTLTFMGATYILSPFIFGRNIFSNKIALMQPYLWFIGMLIFSISYHIAGISGMPRRVSSILSYPIVPQEWITLSQIAMIGGIILVLSGILFISNIGLTLIKGPIVSMNGASLNLNSKADPTLLDNLKIWIIVAVILIVIAYALPFSEIYSRGLSPVLPRLP